MKITLTSVLVDDHDKALHFYTEMLGFVTKTDLPVGDLKWLTVVSPDEPGDIELLLEPNANPAAKMYQAALFAQGIPVTSFVVDDIHHEYARLRTRRVIFRFEPTAMGPVTVAVFEDTCANLIQLAQG
jgi:catechol 2,3-dioxygenase-like lactoylglutathione lyase family enzyme